MAEGYSKDLAYIHDIGFGDFARNSAPALLKIFRDSGITDGLVVDLGCGSGIFASELSRAGYDVLGIDVSPSMIEIARKRTPRAGFRAASLLKARLPQCVAVTSLGECLNYLFDQSNSLQELRRLFRRVYAALKPGGLFIFDIAEPGRGKGPRKKHFEGRDWALLMEVDEDSGTNRLTRRITSFRRVGKFYRHDEEVHVLQLYKRSEVSAVLREAGFRVQTMNRYGEQKMIKGCVAFVAQRR